MANNKFLIIISFCVLAFFSACNNEKSESKQSDDIDTVLAEIETIKKARSIFYSMNLPSEMHKVFEKAGAVYDPSILNPVENVNLYESSHKAALNLGIYGVDLSYNKMFGQNQKTLLYFAVIHKLSQQMGIPDNQFTMAMKKMEKNMSNKDSLTKYATEIYKSTNKFLNDNDRQATAALMLAGGWIEAIHIASTISDQNASNSEIIERIAFQKYSLHSLLSILNNYQEDPFIARYIIMLKALQRKFDKFEILFEAEGMSIDTANKLINASKMEMRLDPKDIKEIKLMIKQIRTEMVN